MDILPDCRAKNSKTINRGVLSNWTPIYCANCGADGGLVPEENMTFAFYLCNKCAETHGQIANTYIMPDEVFWEKLKQEQLEVYGRYITDEEMARELENESSIFSKLLKERK